MTSISLTADQFVGEFVRDYDKDVWAETIHLVDGVAHGRVFFSENIYMHKHHSAGKSGAELKIGANGNVSIHYASNKESLHFIGVVSDMENSLVTGIKWKCTETGRRSKWVRKQLISAK